LNPFSSLLTIAFLLVSCSAAAAAAAAAATVAFLLAAELCLGAAFRFGFRLLSSTSGTQKCWNEASSEANASPPESYSKFMTLFVSTL